jgi:hypothetical protein
MALTSAAISFLICMRNRTSILHWDAGADGPLLS